MNVLDFNKLYINYIYDYYDKPLSWHSINLENNIDYLVFFYDTVRYESQEYSLYFVCQFKNKDELLNLESNSISIWEFINSKEHIYSVYIKDDISKAYYCKEIDKNTILPLFSDKQYYLL